ncbi:calcium-channel protein cch1-like [Teratosphaeria destructans]|uniref:Calcium-channel protein cch1-like n=1 Tax=Teratosphaeria destructans TaxID=418781 RepID=A0A9W7VXY6_9PEZI|nr:calcium-channel protein cch1-like [Teratosphaeria destructans]
MATPPHEPGHRRTSSANNAIPLQDLNHNRASQLDVVRGESHRRTLSDRGRALFNRGREGSRSERSGRYSPLQERSPSPRTQTARPARSSGAPVAYVTSPSGQHERIPDEDDETDSMSPEADRGAFQAAIGFAGLSFNAGSPTDDDDDEGDDDDDDDQVDAKPPRRKERMAKASLPTLRTVNSEDDFHDVQLDDGPAFFSPISGGQTDEADTQPLTDGKPLRPSTLAPVTPDGQRHDRQRSRTNSSLSVRFSSRAGRDRGNSRLGDDLPNLEAGTHPFDAAVSPGSSTRQRSLSVSSGESPLHRTGTMLRKMSQRVVNVSNESDVLEHTARRKPSLKSGPPPVPPLPRMSGDGQVSRESSPGRSPGRAPNSPASEKMPSSVPEPQTPEELPYIDRNPLRGKSLGLLSPTHPVRRRLLELLVHPLFEPFILLLIVFQTVILAVNSSRSVFTHPRPERWGHSWADWAILIIFCIYTVEMIIKILVSGFLFNPREYSTIDRSVGLRKALVKKANDLFALHRKQSVKGRPGSHTAHGVDAPSSLLRSFTVQEFEEDLPGGSRQAQKKRLAHRAFLRHSFNRLDFVAVVSFWISFVLAVGGVESRTHIYVFRMMSCLRILRLLGITSGTSVILRSLKRAAPTLLNVAFLIGFFWLLFAIVGVQSFKSSLRRTCVWNWNNLTNPNEIIYAQNSIANFQFCGGWLAKNGSVMPWLTADGAWGADEAKGFQCPVNSWCIEGENPYNGTVSFDNILQSVEMVFVVMTSNTFTDIMYYLTDTDYLIAALFFALGIIVLSFWLLNLLIAVITSSFQVIREESSSSAFTAEEIKAADEEKHEHDRSHENGQSSPAKAQTTNVGGLKRAYNKTHWFWITVIVFGLLMQCFRSAYNSPWMRDLINTSELGVTLVLLIEIIIRFAADWRSFRHHRRNWVDLGLAIITTIIQTPIIHQSGQPYAWLTVFQILRIYRVVLAVKLTRDLITLVLRHVSGVLNLILFVFLLTFLAAIFAAQLFRGDIPVQDSNGNTIQITFATIWSCFLGMYQILSSENWTTIVYNVTRFDLQYGTAWIGATFFILWFILAFFIVLNMFIAVIQENFDVSEDQKRLQQVRMFLQQKELGSGGHGTLSLSTIFKFGHARRQDPLDFGTAATDMLLKDAVVRDFLNDQLMEDAEEDMPGVKRSATNFVRGSSGWIEKIRDWLAKKLFNREPNPFYAKLQLTKAYEELDPRTLAKEVFNATEQRKITQREYLRRHPEYNTSLYLFRPSNPIRVFCQRIVGPGRGTERFEGRAPNPTVWYTFSAFIYMAIVAMVLLACVTTPLYQKEYFDNHEFSVKNWFVFSDIGFAALFTVEAIIKVIADGFFWTPNAYFRSSWGFIDGVVLVTLWINIITLLVDPNGGSRAVGAFKAFRALRLLNVSDSARDTFHSVIVLGGWKVISAAFVSISLLIPFAIYGTNLFAGQMMYCNDFLPNSGLPYGPGNVANLTDCVNEYQASPNGWNVIAPRVAKNFYYDFDNFGDSLFILFQIVSQEGWVDVMNSATAITGVFTQPSGGSAQGNAVFFVIFNLLGAVFVLTLFVSVFMRNYTEQTGVAFLTTDQRSWLELRKLLRQVAPSKRPNNKKKREGWQEWCYRRAITKTGQWQRFVTAVLVTHLILLCLEWYPDPSPWLRVRDYIFLLFTFFYLANIVIRIIGLSWTRFRKSAWDVYSLFAVTGTFVTTVLELSQFQNRDYSQVHKLFLVSIVLLIIPRNNQLDQLFKTAAASFTAIANLLATWFVLFLVYAIALTQTFGLTRFGTNETGNLNFRTVPKALIFLFRTSVIRAMESTIRATAVPDARALFISWNILSMYIFVNLFISLIYESFSYVYQRSSGLSIISREEIRRYKQAWAEFDPEGKGYISKEKFPRFLGELSGVFEMRIYDGDFSVMELIEDCKIARRSASRLGLDGEGRDYEIDLGRLNRRLAELPVEEVRARRKRMNQFYEEVLVSADPDRGISFNALLMILAHYKVINDNKSLRLEEFLRRRARLQRVEEAVNRNIVVGFFDTLYWRRRFKRAMEAKKNARVTAVPSFEYAVPEIFVQEDEEGAGHVGEASGGKKMRVPSVSITPVEYDPADTAESLSPTARGSPARGSAGSDYSASGAATVVRTRAASLQHSEPGTPLDADLQIPSTRLFAPASQHRPSPSSSSIQPDWHFAAAMEGASPPHSPRLAADASEDREARSRSNSAVSQREVLGVFQESAWGASMRRGTTKRAKKEGGGGTPERRPSS